MSFPFSFADIATVGRARPPVVGGSWVFADDFESYANASEATDSTNWTTIGTPTFGYTTTPLDGTRSLKIDGSHVATTKSFDAGSDPWFFFKWRVSNVSINQNIVTLLALDTATTVGILLMLSTGKLSVKMGAGSSTDTATTPIVANTTYSFWIYLNTTNGKMDVYHSSDETRPASPTVSDLGSSATARFVRFGSTASGMSQIWDKLIVSATAIGSNPTI